MSNCRHCGQSAGFLKSVHKECAEKHKEGWNDMVSAVAKGIVAESPVPELERSLAKVARESYHDPGKVKEAVVAGWTQTVNQFLEDGHLDESEESRLSAFAKGFGLGQDELDTAGAWSRLVKGAVLRDLLNGRCPTRVQIDGDLPFNFQKGEQLIWPFPATSVYEDRTKRQYVGRSSGTSIRIAKGVYYRVGAFKGHPVETVERVLTGTGLLCITNKHLYFNGGKGFRIRHDKIITIEPYDDGVGIQQEQATAKPKFIITGDGWFTFNLLKNAGNV